ncbi:hypothetical protein [Gallaecimonas mangrovi]|uniref:hypothetical protein n=1 Tax=Gallaecimonas mangrovi TaxID=2291597 RepID=UPI000E1FC605|nr:hypothetical protein [Gallaecimonas mangrovi]
MTRGSWIGVFIAAAIVAAYFLAMYFSPRLSLYNQSSHVIEKAEVNLPQGHLDFGQIKAGANNSLYYKLDQDEGQYQYRLQLDNGDVIQGSCGRVSKGELAKRARISLDANGVVYCQ